MLTNKKMIYSLSFTNLGFNVFIKLIQFSNKLSGSKSKVNHSALCYYDKDKWMVLQVDISTGVEQRPLSEVSNEYNGFIEAYETPVKNDIDIINNIFNKHKGSKASYGLGQAFASFEFKKIYLRWLNPIMDFLARNRHKKIFCSQFTATNIHKLSKEYKMPKIILNNKPHPINANTAYEITPLNWDNYSKKHFTFEKKFED